MSEGDVVYRDLAYFNGPLSPAVNAALFTTCGASIATLFEANALIPLSVVLLKNWWIRCRLSVGAAMLGCTTCLCDFAFNEYVSFGNYNWIGPYSHEMTHSLALAGGSLARLIELTRRRPLIGAALAGLLAGLAALTKVEIGVATFAGAGVWFAVRAVASWRWASEAEGVECKAASKSCRWIAGEFGLFALCAAVPASLSQILLSRWLSFGDALVATCGSWLHAIDPAVRESRFYRLVTGTADVGESAFLIPSALPPAGRILGGLCVYDVGMAPGG